MRCICLTLNLFVAVAVLGMAGCKTTEQKKVEEQAAVSQRQDEMASATQAVVQGDDASFDVFINQLRDAVAVRDMQMIASLMTSNFGYRFNPLGEGDGVFQYWDEINVWEELHLVLNEEFVPFNGFMVAPMEFADPNIPYNGYRAGVMKKSGKWRFAYFVKD